MIWPRGNGNDDTDDKGETGKVVLMESVTGRHILAQDTESC